ncbi:MAG: chloride channel protein [Pseudomonadota bacterium]
MSARTRIIQGLDKLRLQTARPDALIQLSILGLIVGLLTGITIVAFLFVIDTALRYLLPSNNAENFEGLSLAARFIFPVVGAILLAVIFKLVAKKDHVVGVVNVLERLRFHEGYMKLRSFILQFIGASIALISGQSMGREGPAIHLGSSIGSLFGQSIGLPNNAMRTLLACGSAAAIGAAFNTPLAGVIFAMEIIIVEYTLASFIPIIIAAVAASGIAHAAHGNQPILQISELAHVTAIEIPFIILLGVLVGIASTFFSITVRYLSQVVNQTDLSLRFIAAGVFTGLVAIAIPQVLGLGYDTIHHAVLGQYSISLLFAIMVCKIITTAVSVSCGLPAGLISPSLVIGSVGGALMGSLLHQWFDIPQENNSLYALIGMSAMMGACLQAPLAALTAVFEVSASHHIIWPSMLAIVIAQLISRQLFRQPPIFDLLLQARGLDTYENPIMQSLHRTGVAKVMSQDFICLEKNVDLMQAKGEIKTDPQWIVVTDNKQPVSLLRGIDLIHFIEQESPEEKLDLMDIPAKRYQLANIDVRATMAKAHKTFNQEHPEALCVTHWDRNAARYVYGVLTKEQFDNSFTR